jgi:OOP family OmpA-OmpF porin
MKKLAIAAFVLTSMSGVASAQDFKPYIGLGFGSASIDAGTTLSGSSSEDDTDTAYKIFAGVDLHQNFALEAGYIDFGTYSLSVPNGSSAVLDGDTVEADGFDLGLTADTTAWTIAAVLKTQVGSVTPYAKLGMFAWDSDFDVTVDGVSLETSTDDGTDMFYGLGLGYSVSDAVSLRAEYEIYDVDGADVDVISAGIVMSF